tara:strand:+ start:2484 stop:2957 length:474 start_codon:yes stop_codon:yes gene_type:complete
MNVYLLRHGVAELKTRTDAERQLSPLGKKNIVNIAAQFRASKYSIDRCIASPYLRARQTAELFLNAIELGIKLESNSMLLSQNKAVDVLRFLETAKEKNILLVGHNPLLSELFGLLTQGSTNYDMKILAAGELCCIHFETVGAGLGKNLFNLAPGKN